MGKMQTQKRPSVMRHWGIGWGLASRRGSRPWELPVKHPEGRAEPFQAEEVGGLQGRSLGSRGGAWCLSLWW